MDIGETIVSWVREAWNASSRLPFEPGFWGVLFAFLVLATVYSIARSLKRLNRQLTSAVSEFEEIRSTLKRIERVLERSESRPSPADTRNQDIRDLPLREGKERR